MRSLTLSLSLSFTLAVSLWGCGDDSSSTGSGGNGGSASGGSSTGGGSSGGSGGSASGGTSAGGGEGGGGSELVMAAEEYLNPGQMQSSHTLNTPVDTPLQPSTPTQKFSFNMPPSYTDTMRNSSYHGRQGYGSQFAVNNAGTNTLGSRSLRYGSNILSASCDPLKFLGMKRVYFLTFNEF